MKKALIALAVVVVVVCLYLFTPVRHYLSQEGFVSLQEWIRAQGPWGPLIFMLIYIAAAVLSLPGSVLTIGGGILFGAAWGTAINLTAATIGATLAFLLARYLGRDFVAKLMKGKLAKLDDRVGQHGFYAVLYLRLIPLFPFNLLNYSLGLSQVRLSQYFLATLIGMAPGCFVYTSLGGVGRYIDWTDPRTWADYHVWGPFALVIVLTVVTKIIQARRRRPSA